MCSFPRTRVEVKDKLLGHWRLWAVKIYYYDYDQALEKSVWPFTAIIGESIHVNTRINSALCPERSVKIKNYI